MVTVAVVDESTIVLHDVFVVGVVVSAHGAEGKPSLRIGVGSASPQG